MLPSSPSVQLSADDLASAVAEIDLLIDISAVYREATASLMDAYAVGRLLRFAPPNASAPQRDAIIYAGEAHAHNIRGFFQYIGIEAVASATPIRPQCLDVPTLFPVRCISTLLMMSFGRSVFAAIYG